MNRVSFDGVWRSAISMAKNTQAALRIQAFSMPWSSVVTDELSIMASLFFCMQAAWADRILGRQYAKAGFSQSLRCLCAAVPPDGAGQPVHPAVLQLQNHWRVHQKNSSGKARSGIASCITFLGQIYPEYRSEQADVVSQ